MGKNNFDKIPFSNEVITFLFLLALIFAC